jgi:hypothetical protein
MQVRDVAPGLWIWRLEHPGWKPGQGWEPLVASTFVESVGHRLVLDPLAPSSDSTDVWNRLDARPPTSVVILKPDHVRDVDFFVRRYRAHAFGQRALCKVLHCARFFTQGSSRFSRFFKVLHS